MRNDPISRNVLMVAGVVVLLGAFSYSSSAVNGGNSVTRITLDPPTPNILLHNQDVKVSFWYVTPRAGVRIFARPFTGGAPSPGYAASGSPLYPTGSGRGNGTFTIRSGNVVVDQIRIQMWNADQSQLLFEAFLPVNYQFREP
jgi:hypothetical protein